MMIWFLLMERKGKYMYSEKEKLKRFAQAIAIPLSISDTIKWPIRAGRALKPVRKEFAIQYAYELDQSIEKFGNSVWKEIFQNPSQLWRVSHHLINGWQESGMSEKQIAEKILLLLQGISVLSNENEFVPIGEHLLYKELPIIDQGLIESKSILKLGAVLWSYCETLYFVAREIGCEYHGPYVYSDRVMLERNYINLFPIDLWGQLSVLDRVKEITIRTVHDKSLDASFDVYNNLIIEKGELTTSFIGGKVWINGQEVDENKIQELINMVSKEIQSLCKLIGNMDTRSIVWQYVRIFWYRKRGLAKVTGKNWEPDEKYKFRYQNDSTSKKRVSERLSTDELSLKYDFSENY